MKKIFNKPGSREISLLGKIWEFLLDLLFPKFCLNCYEEGEFLCQDCLSTIEILEIQFCPYCQKRVIEGKTCQSCKKFTKLDGIFVATSYQNYLVKKLIFRFKYEPFIKELKKTLTTLIINHFLILDKVLFLKDQDFLLIPIPLTKKRLKWRGFNQAREIAQELSNFLEIPLLDDILIKIKETVPQVELSEEERKENIKNAFLIKNDEEITGKKILLVDDVYTTGATMNECARILKELGAKEVWGVVIARE